MQKLLLLTTFLCLAFSSYAQVKIGDNPNTITASSILELESTNKGILITRISVANVNTWTLTGTPVEATLIYNTNAAITGGSGTGFYYWNSTQWTKLATGASASAHNTLDEAYDEGGAGAGRTITADAGSVEILGIGGLNVGTGNILTGTTSIVVGTDNEAAGLNSSVTGGNSNRASGDHSVVSGGTDNIALGELSVVSGGFNNAANSNTSTVAGGRSNIADSPGSVISGGRGNTTSGGNFGVISGGESNTADGEYSVISGGGRNTITGVYNFIGGGENNNALTNNSVISGGIDNTANGDGSIIGGGSTNVTNGRASIVSGGISNTADGNSSIVIGGENNTAYSFSEAVVGLNGTVYTPSSTNAFVGTDRLFNVANGTSSAARSDAFTILKNGNTTLKGLLTLTDGLNPFTLPNTDGTVGQVLTTDGSGSVSWQAAGSATHNTLDQAYDEGGAGAGRTINATNGSVQVAGAGGLEVGNGHTLSAVQGLAVGTSNTVSGANSFSAGSNNQATGANSFSVGLSNVSSNSSDFSAGNGTVASGGNSTAMGEGSIASGLHSTALGEGSRASGSASTSTGSNTRASGETSTAMGIDNTAPSYAETTIGLFATTYTPTSTNTFIDSDRLFNVGNGTAFGARSDAFTIFKGGNATLNGPLTLSDGVNPFTLPNTDGTVGQVLTTDGSGSVSWQAAGSTTHNTLDQAYDEGGAGAGRTINADAGAVTIASVGGLNVGSTNIMAGNRSMALGQNNTTEANNSLAIGNNADLLNIANNSLVVGNNVSVDGANNSIAVGSNNTSVNGANNALAVGDNNQVTVGAHNSVAFGEDNTTSGDASATFGDGNITSGGASATFGVNSTTSGEVSVAFGQGSTTAGDNAATFGFGSSANANTSFALGTRNTAHSFSEMVVGLNATNYTASSTVSFVGTDRLFNVGNGTSSGARSDAFTILKNGNTTLKGQLTLTDGASPFTLPNTDGTVGQVLTTNGSGTVTWAAAAGGGANTLDQAYDQGGAGAGRTIEADAGAVAIQGEGGLNVGNSNNISGASRSMAVGEGNTVSNANSIAGGDGNEVSSNASLAIGTENVVSGVNSVAIGTQNNASGAYSTVFGFSNRASGVEALAFGFSNTAAGILSTASGNTNIAHSYVETVIGSFSTDYVATSPTTFIDSDRLFNVGNGTSNAARSNALTLFKDGRLRLNDAFTFPNTDGTVGQVLTTNGSGIVTWQAAAGANTLDQAYNEGGAGAGRTINANNGSVQIMGIGGLEVGDGHSLIGDQGFATGSNNQVTGSDGAAIGRECIAGEMSASIGESNTAGTHGSIALGGHNIVANDYSIAVGNSNNVSSENNMALGMENTISGTSNALIFGSGNNLSATSAIHIGNQNENTAAQKAMTLGNGLAANDYSEIVVGNFNVIAGGSNTTWVPTDMLFVIGNGTNAGARSNAVEVLKNGDMNINGNLNAISCTCPSDIRLKTNILPLASALTSITKLGGYSYYWKDQDKMGDRLQVGVIAQDVQKLYPNLVHTDATGQLSVNYLGLIPVMIEATKEQQTLISDQDKKIEELENKIEKLESMEDRILQLEKLLLEKKD